MELPGSFGQPLAPRSEEQPLQRQVFFLETLVRTLKFFAGRAGLVEVTFEVVELPLQFANPFEQAAEHLLAGGQVVRDRVVVLRHHHLYVSDGALVGEFRDIFIGPPNSARA